MATTVAQLWRFPVKSMAGEQLARAELTSAGVAGDRCWGLLDQDTGKVVSAKSVRRFPGMLQFSASTAADGVQVRCPDGRVLMAGSAAANVALSAHFGKAVTMLSAAPADFTIDSYDLDLAQADDSAGSFHDQKLGAALFKDMGVPAPVPDGAFVDVFPVSVITTSTLRALAAAQPASDFDLRRFRMNLVLDTGDEGFIENDWLGRELRIGPDLRLRVTMRDPRCAVTTLAQPGLADDRNVLRTLVAHNNIEVAGLGTRPCAGVYAVVETGGTIGPGDAVALH